MGKRATKTQTLESLMGSATSIGASPKQARLVRNLIKKHKLPPDVHHFEVSFGHDAGGDPAMWILFSVKNANNPSREKLSKLNQFASSVRSDLLKASPRFWPYINFRALPESQREPA